MPSKISKLTSDWIRLAISSSVEKPGNSNPPRISSSNATLIRSAGLFFASAASRSAPAATARPLRIAHNRRVRG